MKSSVVSKVYLCFLYLLAACWNCVLAFLTPLLCFSHLSMILKSLFKTLQNLLGSHISVPLSATTVFGCRIIKPLMLTITQFVIQKITLMFKSGFNVPCIFLVSKWSKHLVFFRIGLWFSRHTAQNPDWTLFQLYERSFLIAAPLSWHHEVSLASFCIWWYKSIAARMPWCSFFITTLVPNRPALPATSKELPEADPHNLP